MNTDDLDNFFDGGRILTWRRYPGKIIGRITIDYTDGTQLVLPASPRCHSAEERRAASQAATHSPDFRTVNYFGHVFRFSPTQAPVVRTLWEAWEAGAPCVGQASLLEAAGSSSARLYDVFKRAPAWNVLIVAGDQAGTYRLATRDEVDDAQAETEGR